MAEQGKLKIDMKSMLAVYASVFKTQNDLSEALSEAEKAVYRLTETRCIRGLSASRLQAYLTDGILKLLAEADSLSEELFCEVRSMVQGWYGFESSETGAVSQEILFCIGQTVQAKRTLFGEISAEVSDLLRKAAEAGMTYTVRTADTDEVFDETLKFLSDTSAQIEETDDSHTAAPEELFFRIRALGRQAEKVGSRCRENGVLTSGAAEEAREITADYTTGKKFIPDHFAMSTDRQALLEGQAAAGLFSDVYAAAEFTALGAEYESSAESSLRKTQAYLRAEVEKAQGTASARFTKYLQAAAYYRNMYASTDMKAIASTADFGLRIDSEAEARIASAKIRAGSGALNFSAYAEAGLLSASEKFGTEYKTNFQYGNGFDVQASVCYASAGIGADFLKLKIKDSSGNTVSTDSLFSMKAAAKAKIGAEAKAWQESTTVFEGDDYVINVVTCSVALAFLGGVDISASMPVILPKVQHTDGMPRCLDGEY